MTKKIILLVVLSIVFILLIQLFTLYSVISKAVYRLPNLSSIADAIGGQNFAVEIVNNKIFTVRIDQLSITLEKDGRFMGGFYPTDLRLMRGSNLVNVKFLPDTKFGQIGIDYFTNSLSNYKLVLRGRLLGFIPFTFRMKNFI